MNKLIKAIRRLWLIGTCNHWNSVEVLEFAEVSDEMRWCKRCGQVLSCTNDYQRKNGAFESEYYKLRAL